MSLFKKYISPLLLGAALSCSHLEIFHLSLDTPLNPRVSINMAAEGEFWYELLLQPNDGVTATSSEYGQARFLPVPSRIRIYFSDKVASLKIQWDRGDSICVCACGLVSSPLVKDVAPIDWERFAEAGEIIILDTGERTITRFYVRFSGSALELLKNHDCIP